MIEPHLETSYLELIVNQIPDLICRYSLDKRIVFMNEAIQRLGGQAPSIYVGKSIYEFGYTPEFLAEFEAGFDECVQKQETTIINICAQVGELANKHFVITFVPIIIIQNGESELIGVFSVSRNATQEKNHEISQTEQIENLKILSQRLIKKANKLQDFAYIVSHDLRSPISNLSGLLHLYDSAKDNNKRAEMIDLMKMAVDTLNQTVEDLTEVVRVNQYFEVNVEKLGFRDILKRIEESLIFSIRETNTLIESDFSACDSVDYNKAYLESIFLNLITNAIKYRHPLRPPHIKLTTYLQNEAVFLSCTDNGQGINLQLYGKRIFGLHKTFHGNQDARGVGLFITKNQIEAMGGAISVESEENQGTTFIIQLTPKIDEKD